MYSILFIFYDDNDDLRLPGFWLLRGDVTLGNVSVLSLGNNLDDVNLTLYFAFPLGGR